MAQLRRNPQQPLRPQPVVPTNVAPVMPAIAGQRPQQPNRTPLPPGTGAQQGLQRPDPRGMGAPRGMIPRDAPQAPMQGTTAQWSGTPQGYAPGDGRTAPSTAASAHRGGNGLWQQLPALQQERATAHQPIAQLTPYMGTYSPATQPFNPATPEGRGVIAGPQGAISAPQDFVSSFRGAADGPLGSAPSRSFAPPTQGRVMQEQTYDRGAGESGRGIRAADEAPSGSASHAVEQGDYGSTTTVADVTGEESDAGGVYGGGYANDLEDAGWNPHPDEQHPNVFTEPGNPGATWRLNPETGQLTRVDLRAGYDPMTGDPYVGWDDQNEGRPPRDGEDFQNKHSGIWWKYNAATKTWRKLNDLSPEESKPEDVRDREEWERNRRAQLARMMAETNDGRYNAMQMDPRDLQNAMQARRTRTAQATARAQSGAMRSMGRAGVDPSVAAIAPAELYQNQVTGDADAEAQAQLQFSMQNFQLRYQANQQKLAMLDWLSKQELTTEDALFASKEGERLRQDNTDLQIQMARAQSDAQAMQQEAASRAGMGSTIGSIAGAGLGALATVLTAGMAAPAVPVLSGLGGMGGRYMGSANQTSGLGPQPAGQWGGW